MLQLRNLLITGLLVLLGLSSNAQDIYANSETNSTSIQCVGCAVLNPGNAVDGDNNTHSTLQTGANLLFGTLEQTLIFPVTGTMGDTVVFIFDFSDSVAVDVNALGNISISSMNGTASNNENSVLQAGNLSALDTNKFEYRFYPSNTYDRVRVTITSGSVGFLTRLNIYSARIVRTIIIPGGSGIIGCENPDTQSNSVGGLCTPSTCDVVNPTAILSDDPNDFTTLRINAGVGGSYAEITGIYADTACNTDSATLVIERPGQFLTAAALANIQAIALLNGTPVYTETLQTANLTLVSGGTVYTYNFKPNTKFDAIQIRLNSASVAGVMSELRVYQICLRRLQPPVPVGGRSRTICYNSSTTLTGIAPDSSVVRFYDAPTGGKFLGEGSYTTSNLTTDSTFYLESYDTLSGCASLRRDSVVVRVFPEVVPPDNPQDTVYTCFNRPATITPKPFGNIFKFYSDSLGTDSLFIGNTYVTDTIRKDTVFYIRNTYLGICDGDSIVPVYVRFIPDPFVADIPDTLTYCNNTTITITIREQTPGITYRWYTSDSTLVFTGNPFRNFDLTSDTTLFIETVYGVCAESVNRKRLFIDAIDPTTIDVSVVTDTLYVCPGDTAVAFATSNNDSAIFDWYGNNGNYIFTGNPIKVPDNGDTVRLYVKARLDECSSSDSARLTVIRIKDAMFFDSTRTVCEGSPAMLFSGANIQGAVYSWYDVPSGGTPIFVGDTFVTPPVNDLAIYYFEVSNVSCIGQQRFTIYVTTTSIQPTVAVNRNVVYFCSGDKATVSATSGPPDVTYVSWYNAPASGQLLAVGDTFIFTPSKDSTLVFAQGNFDQCASANRVPVLVVRADSISAVTAPNDTICEGQSTRLTASSQILYANYSWWDQQVGGARLAVANPFNTPVLTNTTVYYVQVEYGYDVCANRPRTPVTVLVERILDAPEVLCDSAGNDFLSFRWNDVGTPNYEISLDGGQTFFTPNEEFGPRTHVVRGLMPDSVVTAIVRAIAARPCANSEYSVARTCVANACGLNNTATDQRVYEICADSSATITLLNLPDNFRIIFDNGAPTTNNSFVFTPPADGQFTIPIQVYIEGEIGCDTLNFSALVFSRPVPVAQIDAIAVNPSITGQFINTYQFMSNTIGDAIWSWNFGDGTGSNQKNPLHTYNNEGVYTVSLYVVNSFGCDDTDTLDRLVTVSRIPDIFIPNTFTPNSDGKNELFKVFGQNIRLESLKIFNIYGNVVFETNDLNKGWDGRYNGEPVPSGDFYYTAVIRDELNIKYEREGTITVIRK